MQTAQCHHSQNAERLARALYCNQNPRLLIASKVCEEWLGVAQHRIKCRGFKFLGGFKHFTEYFVCGGLIVSAALIDIATRQLKSMWLSPISSFKVKYLGLR